MTEQEREKLIEKMAQAAAEYFHDDWRHTENWFKDLYITRATAALAVAEPVIREECVSVTNGLIAELRAENEKLKKENWEHIARGYALLSLLPPETTCGQVQEARAKFAAAAGLKEPGDEKTGI